MITAPQQDWALYEKLTRQSDMEWARRLTPGERFEIYTDFFDSIHAARSVSGASNTFERWAWEQKLANRLRMVDAFTKRDQLLHERSASTNAR
jgi:hypothetical protein